MRAWFGQLHDLHYESRGYAQSGRLVFAHWRMAFRLAKVPEVLGTCVSPARKLAAGGEYRHVARPVPGPGQALIKVAYDGTNLMIYLGKHARARSRSSCATSSSAPSNGPMARHRRG